MYVYVPSEKFSTWRVNSLWCHMVTQIWVNIGSGNDLLPDSTMGFCGTATKISKNKIVTYSTPNSTAHTLKYNSNLISVVGRCKVGCVLLNHCCDLSWTLPQIIVPLAVQWRWCPRPLVSSLDERYGAQWCSANRESQHSSATSGDSNVGGFWNNFK